MLRKNSYKALSKEFWICVAVIIKGYDIYIMVIIGISVVLHIIKPEAEYMGDLVLPVIVVPQLLISDECPCLLYLFFYRPCGFSGFGCSLGGISGSLTGVICFFIVVLLWKKRSCLHGQLLFFVFK